MNEIKPSFLSQVQNHAAPIIRELDDTLVYHNLSLFNRLQNNLKTLAKSVQLPEEDLEMLLIANWLQGTLLKDATIEIKNEIFIFDQNPAAIRACSAFLQQINYPENKIRKVIGLLKNAILRFPPQPQNHLENVFADALVMDFVGKEGRKHLYQVYDELILQEVEISKKDWFDMVLDLLVSFTCYTKYGKQQIEPQIVDLQIKLQKEKKELLKRKDILLKKELGISDAELKKLKKQLRTISGRDERGIQTLFRTTSKNHYVLKDMVDRKASIMITVNSIILSLVVGGFIGEIEFGLSFRVLPSFILTVFCAISIIYAILAIRPNRTQGEFTEEEIRSKQGNLLYFGNFHNMHLRDYEWGVLQMLNDRNYLYSALIKDIYYLGQILQRKYNLIRVSLNAFLIGFVLTIISSLLVRLFVL